MPRFSVAEWLAQSYRLTAFPSPGSTYQPAGWWDGVTDTEPDETNANPKRGSSVTKGTYETRQLSLKTEPSRIDWELLPTLDEGTDGFQNLGSFVETVEIFSRIAARWLSRDDLPNLNRLALGIVLLRSETDRRVGYERISAYVPVRIDPDSSDFLYQINLPKKPSALGIEGLLINRLSRWSIVLMKPFSLLVTGDTLSIGQPGEPQHAFRLELDINNAPTFEGPIPGNRLVELYRELADEARTIATNGVNPE
jgi:hypothetical protein